MRRFFRELRAFAVLIFSRRGASRVRHEHPIVEEPPSPILRTFTAWTIAVVGTILGIWLGLAEDRLRNTLYHAARAVRVREIVGHVAWDAVAFWILTMLWARLLYLRLSADDEQMQRRTMTLLQAIHRAPNLLVVRDYPSEYYRRIAEILDTSASDSGLSDGELAMRIAYNVRSALTVAAQMARTFARAESAVYGANIMLVANRAQFTDSLLRRLVFHDPKNAGSLIGMLYLPEELLVSRTSDASTPREIPLIALPVPAGVTDLIRGTNARGEKLALPGAPTALLGGDPSVYMDVSELARECEDFAKPIRTDIAHYFSPSGQGKHIGSFASFRLSADPNAPVGVLNIDSSQPYVLGRDREYYVTFYALIEPLLHLFRRQVEAYARLRGPALLNGGGVSPGIPVGGVEKRAI